MLQSSVYEGVRRGNLQKLDRMWKNCLVEGKPRRRSRQMIILRSVGEVLVPLVAKCLFTKSSLQNKNNSKDCVVDLRVTKGLDAKQKGKGRE